MNKVWGDDAPTTRTVYNWISHFKGNSERLSDLPDRGRSTKATSKHNIEAVKAVIDENPYATFDEIEVEISISRGTKFTILHGILVIEKVTLPLTESDGSYSV